MEIKMEIGYQTSKGILLSEELKTIPKKSKNPLQPIFEALMNSFEAIEKLEDGKIIIDFNIKNDLYTDKEGKSQTEKFYFTSITISDNGVGFNEREFERIFTLRDNTKNVNNKGTGRIQFLHYFEETHFNSIYKDITSKYKNCEFILSKANSFLVNNAIILVEKDEETKSKALGTTITFKKPLDDKDYDIYTRITPQEVKDSCISYYLQYFCENVSRIPSIEIKRIVGDVQTKTIITKNDIPKPTHSEQIDICYSSLKDNQIISISKKEAFTITIFLIGDNKLLTNNIILTSKGAEAIKFPIDCLLPSEKIDGNRYLVLVSSNYIDQKDSDTRGELKILSSEQYIEQNKDTLAPEEVILIDTIIKDTNSKLSSLRPEIENKFKEKQQDIEELKHLFLLNEYSVQNSDIKYDDSDETVLRKVYQADAKIAAKKDAALKKLLKEAEEINIKDSKNYQHEIDAISKKYVQVLPLQNRNELAQYIARRRILLNCIDRILDKYQKIENDNSNIKEVVLHNLIFPQYSTDTANSNLWFINEEYIYYKGYSDTALSKIEVNEKKIFKDAFSTEEENYLISLGENRKIKRPDVLLFPSEGKCIIIEFKAPSVNVSYYLSEIPFYAGLIANYSKNEFKFKSFYGYLVGESIEPKDILKTGTGDWVISEHLDYIYRPLINIYDDFVTGKVIGTLYTEVIKYSTLFERAKIRNKIFIEKLEGNKTE